MRVMSLRRRLILTVLVLLVLGLVGMASGIFVQVREHVSDQADQQLTTVGQALERVLGGDPDASLSRQPTPAGHGALLLGALAADGQAPSFIQVRGPDGRILDTVELAGGTARPADAPKLPEQLAIPPEIQDRPGSAAFRTIDGHTGADVGGIQRVFGSRDRGAPNADDDDWRLRLSSLPDGRVLIVGMHRTELDALIRQIATMVLGMTGVALAAVTLLALRAIRQGMRPLEQIAATARAIGAGDLTRRVEQAEPRTEIGRLGMALNAMLGQIESAVREREASEAKLRRFVADASHELRTPVASVRAYAELFRRGAASRPDDLARAMGSIEAEARRMSRLVDELLLLARLDQGRPLEREPLDLGGVAADAVTAARALDPDRPLELRGDRPVQVTGDADRLRQVLDNLLANVRQHLPAGTPATVTVRADGDTAVVEVADQGPGLTEEQQGRVFERFYRADRSHGRGDGGAGLGLPIVAAVARAHGGTAQIVTGQGGGVTVQIRLPRTPPRAPAKP